jgi:hypothetical protein
MGFDTASLTVRADVIERAERTARLAGARRVFEPERRAAGLAFFLAGVREEVRERLTRLDFGIGGTN